MPLWLADAANPMADLGPLLRHLASGRDVILLPLAPGRLRPRFAMAPRRAGVQALVRLVTGAPEIAGRLVLTTGRGLDHAAAHLLEQVPADAFWPAMTGIDRPQGPAALPPSTRAAHLAALLDLPCLDSVVARPTTEPPDTAAFLAPDHLDIRAPAGPMRALAADDIDPGGLAAALRRVPELRGQLAIATRQTLRDSLLATHGPALVTREALALAERQPGLAARTSVTPLQTGLVATTLAGIVSALALAPAAMITILSLVATLSFLSVASLRLAAAHNGFAPPFAPPRRPLAPEALPTYCVLVPLHREAAALPGLVAALAGLDYPVDRLDIKLLIESDDDATFAAARLHAGRAPFDIVRIPDAGPRTKPKALGIGLALTRADLVTVFDAEDRPDAGQLREAAEIFAAAEPDLACVQGRLTIDHVAGGTWIARLFGLDYVMHFDGLLPFLARHNLLFPLGGTSNHFRRTALAQVLGWDAYNVTEDADLAVRLRRAGFSMTLMQSTTREEATETPKAWIRQRSRWFKGWIQTWFVHMRTPLRLARELGLRNFLLLQLLFPVSLGTVAAFPLSIALVTLYLGGLQSMGGESPASRALFALHGTSFVAGLGGAGLLAIASLATRPLPLRRQDALLLVPYWLMMAAALAWAVIDLVRRPHYWDKTDHARAVRPGATAGGQVSPATPIRTPDSRPDAGLSSA